VKSVVKEASVAVVDIGSNSIKVLVAGRAANGRISAQFSRTIDARISAGISRDNPRLSEEGMARGLDAIQQLLADAAPYSPERAQLVATSAVRDAANGAEFRERIRRATGFEVRLLSGEEEANAIGRGLTCDPALADLENFYVFDLGGGSLECLSFAERQARQEMSLQLGCVRLAEKFVADHAAPFSHESRMRVMGHVRAVLAESGFRFDLPDAAAVATGGTVSTVRAIQGAKTGRTAEETSPVITVGRLHELLNQIAALPLPERQQVPGLPAARADVFPVALATFIAIAETGDLAAFRHSFYNLRWGIAAELLQSA
jgi:exopolyphosphatase/guanosine-5'-triphosphate,3'-diphosphate pyrophosphatase